MHRSFTLFAQPPVGGAISRKNGFHPIQIMRRIHVIGTVAICLLLSGCGLLIGGLIRDNNRRTQDETQVTASLARYRQLVMEDDADRLSDMFTAHGELSHNTETPHVGFGPIRTFLKSFTGYKVNEYQLTAVSIKVTDRSAAQHGTYSQRVAAPDGTIIKASGSFDAAWIHESDGRWLLTRMHTSSESRSSGD